jgi:uncharacterized damage-inducible protein DinB
MQSEHLRRMIDYHYWAQKRVWNCLMPLTEEQMHHDPGYSVGSLHTHLAHAYVVEWMWYHIVLGDLPDDPAQHPRGEELQTREIIRARWNALEADVRAFIQTVTDEQLNRTVYQTLANPPRPSKAWESVIYMVTHAADHRSQMLQLIHSLGGETVMQDFITYVWEQGEKL